MAAWRSKCHHAFLRFLVHLYPPVTPGHRCTSKKGGEGSCSSHTDAWSPCPLRAASMLSWGLSLHTNHSIDPDFRVMVQVLMVDFLPVFPTGDAARTMTYSWLFQGCPFTFQPVLMSPAPWVTPPYQPGTLTHSLFFLPSLDSSVTSGRRALLPCICLTLSNCPFP